MARGGADGSQKCTDKRPNPLIFSRELRTPPPELATLTATIIHARSGPPVDVQGAAREGMHETMPSLIWP